MSKGRRCCSWGTELIQFLVALAILHQDDLKKRMNRITATGRKRRLGKLVIIWFTPHPLQTVTKPNSPKMDVLQKTFPQIILAAKRL